MRFFPLFLFILIILAPASASSEWTNYISVHENSINWIYTETFNDEDSIIYKENIDREFGNNDSFISSWELLKTDKKLREDFLNSIKNELDVKINDRTELIEIVDVGLRLSPDTLGRTNISNTIINKYNVSYNLKNGISNTESLWFMGLANSHVTVVFPKGIEVVDITGLKNIKQNITNHIEISGIFEEIDENRGEIRFKLRWTQPEQTPTPMPTQSITVNDKQNINLSKIKTTLIVIIGIVMILLIYIFKIRRY